MKTNIVKIGNSKGIIIPSIVLKEFGLTTDSEVILDIKKNKIVLKKSFVREGWKAAAKKLQKAEEEQLISDVFEDENFDEWVWE